MNIIIIAKDDSILKNFIDNTIFQCYNVFSNKQSVKFTIAIFDV